MKYIKSIITAVVISLTSVVAQEADAMRDIQLGMAGLQEASKNPALLAQLMQDLQVSRLSRSHRPCSEDSF